MKSMQKLMGMAAIVLLFVFNTGCSDEDKGEGVILEVTPSEIQCTAKGEAAEGSSLNLAVNCNTAWQANVDAQSSWCTVTPAAGNGTATLTVKADEYDGKTPRTATITFSAEGQTALVKVVQTAAIEVFYEITIPDFSGSFVYNVMNDKVKVAEICREATPGKASADGKSLTVTPEAVVTLYLMKDGKYPEEGIVLSNGGTIKHDGSKYTAGTAVSITKFYLTQTGAVKNSVEGGSIEALEVVPDLLEDTDGNKYKITKIGSLYWMAENFRCQTYSDGVMEIKIITDSDKWEADRSGACCYYANDKEKNGIYGLMYNGYAVKNGRGLAPKGWQLPTNGDWKTMLEYLGGGYQSGYNDRIFLIGGFLRTGDLNTWKSYYPEGHPAASKHLNTTGFSGMGGGYHDEYDPSGLNSYCYYWADIEPSEIDEDFLYRYTLDGSAYQDAVYIGGNSKSYGLYVRFVRK